jgi:WD40 repeat protein
VWLAEDTRIARQVALKFMPSSFALLSSEKRRRFQREAEVVSRLEHPSICPVFEAQIDHDPPYIAMRLVEGETLAAVIARARVGQQMAHDTLALPPRTPVELRRVLLFFERVARTLHAAHEAGVVHRDIKPGNVMVTKSGEPVVLDFGQARDERADQSERTLSGEVLGTPAYMSPEQIEGSAHGLDRRTDVWSLGASLYETLTLVRPFHGDNVPALMHSIRTSPLPDSRTRSKFSDEDVAVVLETALEKDLKRRYATALELAEDLRRIREYEPIHARPAGPILKLHRWAQRHPALALALTAAVIGVCWSFYLLRREGMALREKNAAAEREADALRERSAAQAREIQALQREAAAIDSALGRYLAVRTLDLLPEDPAAALAVALKSAELAPGYQARCALLAALADCWLASVYEDHRALRMLDIDVSSDGRWIVGGTPSGVADVWSLGGGHLVRQVVADSSASIEHVRFGADAQCFATASATGRLHLWRTSDATCLGALEPTRAPIAALEYVPASDRFVALGRDGHGAVMRGDTLACVATFELPAERFNVLRPTADGCRVLATSGQFALPDPMRCNEALVLDAATGRVLLELRGHSDAIADCDVSPDGTRAATGALDGTVRVWSLANGAQLGEPLLLGAALSCVRFTRDGHGLLTGTDADEESSVTLFDLATRTATVFATPSTDRIQSIDVCQANGKIVVASRDTSVSFWSESGELLNTIRERLRPVSVRWTDDGSRVVTFAQNWYAHTWWGESRPDVYELRGHAAPIRSVEFSPQGNQAWTLSADGVARLWHTQSDDAESGALEPGAELARFGDPGGEVVFGRFAHDASLLLLTRDGRVGRLAGSEFVLDACIDGEPIDCDLAPNEAGSTLAVVSDDGGVFVHSMGRTTAPFVRIAGDATCARFVDAHTLVLGGRDDRLRLVYSDGAPLRDFTWDSRGKGNGVLALAVRPDGRELAVACADTWLRYFTTDGAPREHADSRIFPTSDLAYDRESKFLLAVGARRNAVRVYSFEEAHIVRDQIVHTADITGGSFDASGQFVLTSSKDGSVFVRETSTGEPVARRADFGSAVTAAAFSIDSGPLRIINGCEDGRVFVWPVDPEPAARARQPRDLWDWEDAREQRLAAPLPYR